MNKMVLLYHIFFRFAMITTNLSSENLARDYEQGIVLRDDFIPATKI